MYRSEEYVDKIARLYPISYPDEILGKSDRRLTQTVTFQVTDECNLACCFVAGTKVLMANGSYKNIEDVKINDKVIAFDKPGTYSSKNVDQIFFLYDEVETILFTDCTSITGTFNHELFTTNGPKEIKDINIGDTILSYKGTKTVKDKIYAGKQPVYNIGVADLHTYIASNVLTKNCYCYQIHKGKRKMSFETAKKFIDMLLSGEKGMHDYINPEKSPGLIVDFIGGEPFLEVELIDQICTYLMDRLIDLQHPWAMKTMFSICSNGILYEDENVQKFLNKWASRLSFSITIDGNKELHDSCRIFPDGSPSYDIAIAAVKDWIGKGYYMGSKITIAPENVAFLYDAIKHITELGYVEVNANCVYEEGWNPIHATVFYDQLKRISDYFLEKGLDFERDYFCSLFNEDFFHPKKEDDLQNWCGGDGFMISVDPDGEIYPCIRYMESSLGSDQEPYAIGNVDIGVGKCDCHKCRIECLKKIDRRTQSTDECFNCPIAEGCSWCTAYNYQVFGTPDARATYICIMHKARALANAYFWNKYYRKNNIKKRMKIYVPDSWALEIISQSELNMLKDLTKEDY